MTNLNRGSNINVSQEVSMTIEDVIELIKEHRDQHFPSAVGGDEGDSLRWSEAGFQRAMVQEYDALLDEILRGETHAKSRSHVNSLHAAIPH
jgi:hypothetical protein